MESVKSWCRCKCNNVRQSCNARSIKQNVSVYRNSLIDIQEYQENNNDSHLADLFEFVTINQNPNENVHKNDSTAQYLRVATLLTGINKPDHFQYFKLLASRMQKQKIAQTIFLPARDCPTARAAIETLVSCVLNRGRKHKYQDDIAMVIQ